MIDQVHRDSRLRLAFLSAVVSLAAAFAASSAPIPPFNLYRAEDGCRIMSADGLPRSQASDCSPLGVWCC
ncbi:hypothetical protein ACQPYH_27960 [Kribbella sp. CA-245084]|uniref:hypothetical protein n=1 Tax=Kribbella sp. CA-245084 TaxID=3239940 RepID=UPI003D9046B2